MSDKWKAKESLSLQTCSTDSQNSTCTVIFHQSIYPKLVFSFSHMTLSPFTKSSTESLTKPWRSLQDIGQGHRWPTSMSPPFPVNISKNQTSNRPLGTSRTQQSIITRFLEFRIEWRNWQVEYVETFRLNPKARATLAGRSKTGRDSRSTTEPP